MSPGLHDKLLAAIMMVFAGTVMLTLCSGFTLKLLILRPRTVKMLHVFLWASGILFVLDVIAFAIIN